MTDPAYRFYQQVCINADHPDSEIAEQSGLILGMAEDDQGAWTYGVFFPHLEQVVVVQEVYLTATGLQFARENFYDDTASIQVEVNPATGEGRLK